ELSINVFLFFRRMTGHDDLELYVRVPASTFTFAETLSSQPEPLAGLRPGGHPGFYFPIERGQFDRSAQDCLPRCDRYLDAHIITVHCKRRVRLDPQTHEQFSGLALTFYFYHRPVSCPRRNVDVNCSGNHNVTRSAADIANRTL